MAPKTTFDGLLTQVFAEAGKLDLFFTDCQTATTATFLGSQLLSMGKSLHPLPVLPSLPSGISGYYPTSISMAQSSTTAHTIMVAKLVDLGSLDISGPTFTDGSAMPTITELGLANVKLPSPVLVEVTAALNGTPGSLQITYKDQADNTAESNTAQTMTASAVVGTVGWAILNAGDIGVVDITTATRTGGTTPTGTVKFWGVIPICFIPVLASGQITQRNLITHTFLLNNLAAGDQLHLIWLGGAVVKGIMGSIYYVGDST